MTPQSQDTHQNREPDMPRSLLEHVSGDEHQPLVDGYESLAAALKTGFLMLKAVMIVLGIVFLFSNMYWVPEGSIAIQVRAGSILNVHDRPVRAPGGPYFALPYPADRIIRIPTTIQTCAIDRAFWIEDPVDKTVSPENDNRYLAESFRPGEDGSLITADKNVVQGIWNVRFKVDYTPGQSRFPQPVLDFIKNTGTLENAARMLRTVSEGAIVRAVAQTRVSDFVKGNIDTQAITEQVNQQMRSLNTGLTVTDISSALYAVPKKLTKDFQTVTQAESEKALEIEKAVRYRVSTLNELAGEDWDALLDAIQTYETAEEDSSEKTRQEAFQAAEALILSSRIGGLVAGRINQARIEKTQIIEQARAAAERFNTLLPSYKKNPGILRNQLLQDVMKAVWASSTVQTYTFPANQNIYLNLEDSSEWQP